VSAARTAVAGVMATCRRSPPSVMAGSPRAARPWRS
jgi:hypothetical protein